MAYLLVVRGTLLDKLEALEERYQALTEECDEKDEQIKVCNFVFGKDILQ